MIRFACPACQCLLESPDHKSGTKISCPNPKCGQRLLIPSIGPPRTRNKTMLGSLVGYLASGRAKWFYTRDGKTKRGPFSGAELQDLVNDRELLPTDMIWKRGMPNWVPAQKVKGLAWHRPQRGDSRDDVPVAEFDDSDSSRIPRGTGGGLLRASVIGIGLLLVLFAVTALIWPGFLRRAGSGGQQNALLAYAPANSTVLAGARLDRLRKDPQDWQALEAILQKTEMPPELIALLKDGESLLVAATHATPPQVVVVFRSQVPVDIEKLRSGVNAGPAKEIGGKKIHPLPVPEVPAAFLALADAKTVVAGTLAEAEFLNVMNAAGKAPAVAADLLAQVQKVAGNSLWAVSANAGPVKQTLTDMNPAEFPMVPGAGDLVKPLKEAKGFSVWLQETADKGYEVGIGATCADGGAATPFLTKLRDAWNQQGPQLLQMAQAFASGSKQGKGLTELIMDLANLKLEKDGAFVYAAVKISPRSLQSLREASDVHKQSTASVQKPGPVTVHKEAFPNVPKKPPTVVSSADKTRSANNMKQILLSLQNYHDTFQALPPAVVFDKQGKPLYSWRVLLLPYVEEFDIYQQFKFDEPWDSPNNLPLSKKVVRVYASPVPGKSTDPAATFYQLITSPSGDAAGPLPVFRPDPKSGLAPLQGGNGVFRSTRDIAKIPGSFPDGTSNTILVAEAATAVPWSKPDDIVYEPNRPLASRLGGIFSGAFHVGMADGRVIFIDPQQVSEKTLRNAITANDGMALGPDWPK